MSNTDISTMQMALPLGATLRSKGVNFSIFSRHATRVALLLFKNPEDSNPMQEIELDPINNKTGDVWHIFIEGLGAGVYYMYRVDGPDQPLKGHRFNWDKFLLDPYAKAVTGNFQWDFWNNKLPKGIVIDPIFDWQGDKPLNYPLNKIVIYEAHLKGLTKNTKSHHAGSYLGLIDQIPYLKELGITSVELLPVFEFDELEYGFSKLSNGAPRKNYWGYSTMAFFTPKYRYSSTGNPVNDFKTMVRELHKNGIEVILDVVFNHTFEGNENGPTISFKGIDNKIYYTLYNDKRHYWNYSGCGNTFNCNHPVSINFIIDCLRYWVSEMHVDGFRFDLASIMCRDGYGNLMEKPPLIEMINGDALLHSTKMIAEPWDAGGGYQVGHFPSKRFAEWNDCYRDDIRRYWKGDSGMTGLVATRIAGSSDLYGANRKPTCSVNYITAHDGFTLADLVSYNGKHNEANGEGNRDGSNNNYSYNCGVEGETDDKEVLAFRKRQMKNMILTLMLSQGVPMILAGDELGRSQKGNNNAYCQDNELSYLDYTLKEKNNEIYQFFKLTIALRKESPIFNRKHFYAGQRQGGSEFADMEWYNTKGDPKDWQESNNCFVGRMSGEATCTGAEVDSEDIAILFNPSFTGQVFVLPPSRKGYQWLLKADTYCEQGIDIFIKGKEMPLKSQASYTVQSHSTVVLVSSAIE